MFHLVTHAFFKALLFLAAGSVMHAMGGVIDIGRFGGLRRRLPTTHWTFLFGALALSGVFPFAGFWSKDAILAAVRQQASGGPAAATGVRWPISCSPISIPRPTLRRSSLVPQTLLSCSPARVSIPRRPDSTPE